MLDDYCEALDDANKTTVVRKAVRAYISNNLARNEGAREKFTDLQHSRARRRGAANTPSIGETQDE